MSEHLHLVNQLAHHDAAIGALSSRMTGVEATLGHVQEKVGALDSKLTTGFSAVESLIRENRAAQGPGLADLLRGVATGGAIVGMSAAAITMLVTSFVEPKLVAVQKVSEYLVKQENERSNAELNELYQLRDRRRDRLDELSDQVGRLMEYRAWSPTVKKAKD